MKQLFISLLALMALAGCSKSVNIDERNDDKDNVRVPVQLTSGIGAVTRAPITDKATVRLEFWEATAEPTDYTKIATATWNSTAVVATTTSSAPKITLNPLVYYNANDDIKTFIKGWFPNVVSASGVVTIPNTDGTVDVLLCNTTSGSKYATLQNQPVPLVFDHQSAQLVFNVQGDVSLLTGTKISEIKVKNAEVPTGITLKTGSTDVVTYTAKTPLTVPNLTATVIPRTGNPIVPVVVGDPLMIKPVNDNTTLKLDIKTVKADGSAAATYTDVTFKTDNSKLEKGKAYTITLTFKQNEVVLSAKITPWGTAAGSGDVI